MSNYFKKKKQFNTPRSNDGELLPVIQPGLYWEGELCRLRDEWANLHATNSSSVIQGSRVGEIAVKFPDKLQHRVMAQQCLLTSPWGFEEIRALRGQREITSEIREFLRLIADGYLYVWLPLHPFWTGKTTPVPLHQVVAELFVPYNKLCTDYDRQGNEILKTDLEVDHLDGDRLNNAASNLVFVPPEINKRWVGWSVERKLELLRSPNDPYFDHD